MTTWTILEWGRDLHLVPLTNAVRRAFRACLRCGHWLAPATWHVHTQRCAELGGEG